MTTITVKNIPVELYERLKQSAEANRRSINSEVIACIEHTVTSQPLDVDALIQRARRLREKAPAYILTDDDFNQAKRAGRV